VFFICPEIRKTTSLDVFDFTLSRNGPFFSFFLRRDLRRSGRRFLSNFSFTFCATGNTLPSFSLRFSPFFSLAHLLERNCERFKFLSSPFTVWARSVHLGSSISFFLFVCWTLLFFLSCFYPPSSLNAKLRLAWKFSLSVPQRYLETEGFPPPPFSYAILSPSLSFFCRSKQFLALTLRHPFPISPSLSPFFSILPVGLLFFCLLRTIQRLLPLLARGYSSFKGRAPIGGCSSACSTAIFFSPITPAQSRLPFRVVLACLFFPYCSHFFSLPATINSLEVITCLSSTLRFDVLFPLCIGPVLSSDWRDVQP